MPNADSAEDARFVSGANMQQSVPPHVCTLAPYQPAVTHVKLSYVSPDQAWLWCMEVLEQDSQVTVRKINRSKHSAVGTYSSTAQKSCYTCGFKMYQYLDDEGTLFEFQRRTGDPLCFADFYRHMMQAMSSERVKPESSQREHDEASGRENVSGHTMIFEKQ